MNSSWILEPPVKCAGTVQLYVHKQHMKSKQELCVAASFLRLLKVSVNLKAVVARVGNGHMSVWGEGKALGAVQRVRWGVDVW